jgi:hypothetical protein
MTPDEEAEEVTETGDSPADVPPEAESPPQLSEEEMAILEQQMKELRVEDLLTQTVASVLNLSARRIVKEDEVDLEQAKTGIDAVRALVPFLPEEIAGEIQEPLSQIQLLYAQRSGASDGPESGTGDEAPGQQAAGAEGSPDGPRDSGLWTPPGS